MKLIRLKERVEMIEETKMSQQGIVFNIQRFTIHDGPGLRTELFLKGCPMHCAWCSNPEGQQDFMQPGVYQSKCLTQEKCGLCEIACREEGALRFEQGKLTSIDYSKCNSCMECSAACPSEAIKQWGRAMSVEECMKEIRKDRGFYERSGGGVTVSGGEPLLQSEFVEELFRACREEGFHTCCESTLHVDWDAIQRILPYTDLLISDIKHMNSKIHKRYTGADNSRILKNLKKLAVEGCKPILRIPVIPGVNDDMDNIRATADFIQNELDGQVRALQLLSFMRLGEEKYQSLGMSYRMKGIDLDREAFQKQVEELAKYFNSRGIYCLTGTREKE